jgi:hypothetical protein
VWVLLAAGALSGCSQLTSFLGGAPAAITSFSTSDPLVSSGDTVTLSWTVTGDAPLTLTLDPGGVDVSGSDHHDVSPTTTTDYTLHASNAAGSDDREVTVTVVAAGDTALQVNVTGLPAGAEAQVSVSDHATVMRWVRGSDGLTMLPPGGYTVAAAPVTVAGTSYQPQVPLQSLTLADGDTGSVDVSYASTPDDPYATPPDVRACKAGTLSQAARDRALARLNFLRVLVGLPAVPYDAAHDADVQAASLIFAANAAISHTPDGGWTCYTPAGASGAGSSNIAVRAKSSSFTPTPESFIDQWGDDVDVSSLGHRRWLVDPFLSQIAFGMVHGATNVAAWPYAAGSAVRVINAADAVVDTLALEYVAYPRGDFPAEMFSSDWFLSFSVLADPTSRWNNGSRWTLEAPW